MVSTAMNAPAQYGVPFASGTARGAPAPCVPASLPGHGTGAAVEAGMPAEDSRLVRHAPTGAHRPRLKRPQEHRAADPAVDHSQAAQLGSWLGIPPLRPPRHVGLHGPQVWVPVLPVPPGAGLPRTAGADPLAYPAPPGLTLQAVGSMSRTDAMAAFMFNRAGVSRSRVAARDQGPASSTMN